MRGRGTVGGEGAHRSSSARNPGPPTLLPHHTFLCPALSHSSHWVTRPLVPCRPGLIILPCSSPARVLTKSEPEWPKVRALPEDVSTDAWPIQAIWDLDSGVTAQSPGDPSLELLWESGVQAESQGHCTHGGPRYSALAPTGQWSAPSGSPRNPAWRRRHDRQAGLEGKAGQIQRPGRGLRRGLPGAGARQEWCREGQGGAAEWTGTAPRCLETDAKGGSASSEK